MFLIPDELTGRAFTSRQANALGITRQMLRGRRFRRLHRDVYVLADTECDLRLRALAALLALPRDAVCSHTTALHLRGIAVAPPLPLHFSTNSAAQVRDEDIVLHRRRGRLWTYDVDGVPCLGPDRTFIDAATQIGLVGLVTAGDALIHAGWTTRDVLTQFTLTRHLDGVVRARRALKLIRAGSESPRETLTRLLLVFARLPEPETNRVIVDDVGTFLARGDLVYSAFKVVVEYDGIHHERDPRQRQRDRERREQLEAAGWRVIVITSADLAHPTRIAIRVHAALVARGYHGPGPQFSDVWRRMFTRPLREM